VYVTGAITISVRQVQNKLMKKVGDEVGYYPILPNMTATTGKMQALFRSP
jgi:hypothetical protein